MVLIGRRRPDEGLVSGCSEPGSVFVFYVSKSILAEKVKMYDTV